MLIYSETDGPRFRYITRFFLTELCGFRFSVTQDREVFLQHPEPGICYASEKLRSDAWHIVPSGWLKKGKVDVVEPEMAAWDGIPILFPGSGNIPFDVFSAAFFLVSRYEEYWPGNPDLYGRYDHTRSLAFRKGFLQLPLIDIWGNRFREIFSSENRQYRSFAFHPTYDVDMAWSYLHKGILRNVGGAAGDLVRGNMERFITRMKVLLGRQADPFDTFTWLDELHTEHHSDPLYFFHVGARNSRYDKQILPEVPAMKDLIMKHARRYTLGIHPSWASRNDEHMMRKEWKRLCDMSMQTIMHNRFHYLAFQLPEGYRKLIRLGITDDHSMGYGTINGFRASVSIDFPWYDLKQEEETSLRVHPFCWMDANSHYELRQSAANAFAELSVIRDQLKILNGTLSVVFHQNFFGDDPAFQGWSEGYTNFFGLRH